MSRKKSRVSRPRSSGKSFHFSRRTFSRSPTGCPSRRFAVSAAPAFSDRSPFLCRRSTFLCRRANFFCRRVSPGEAAPKGAARRGDPTASVRSTLRLAPTADLIRPFRRRNPPCPADPFCHHSPTRLRPLPDLPLTTAKSRGGHSPTSASLVPPIPPISAVHSSRQATSTVCSVWSYFPTRFGILPDPPCHRDRSAPPYSPTLTSKRPRITRFLSLDNPCHEHSNPGTVS